MLGQPPVPVTRFRAPARTRPVSWYPALRTLRRPTPVAFRGIDGFGELCNGGYVHQAALPPVAPGISGQFGQFGQAGTIVAGIIGTVATLAGTVYQLDMQRRLAKSAEHQIARDAAEAAAAAAAAAAQQEAALIQATAMQQAELQATTGAPAPSGGSVLNQIKSVPVWVWPAAGGGLLLLYMVARKRRRAA